MARNDSKKTRTRTLYTIRDVARLAGVSVATASAVINGKDIVSSKLKRRVEQAMAALDYHPDHVARSLRARRSHTIGMVIPDVSNPFFTDVVQGVEEVACIHGYSVILSNSNEDSEREQLCLSNLYSRRVDGVLLAPTDMRAVEDRLTQRRFPIVLFDRVPPGFRGSAVTTDSFGAAHEATRHIIGLGHQRIAIITGRLDLPNGRDRLEGFRKAMQEANRPVRDEYVAHGDFSLESGYRCAMDLMRVLPPPTAVFVCNNKMTLGLMRALAELSIPCPQRVSVLGFDDFAWSAAFNPRLSTVAQLTYEMGRKAMELLLNEMQRPHDGLDHREKKVLVLKAELRLRDSVGPPPPDVPGLTG